MTKEQECMKALQCLYLEVPSVIADDVKQKVIDALNEVKNCTIPDVINRRELLIDFLMEVDEVYGMHIREDAEKCADNYLKSINSL